MRNKDKAKKNFSVHPFFPSVTSLLNFPFLYLLPSPKQQKGTGNGGRFTQCINKSKFVKLQTTGEQTAPSKQKVIPGEELTTDFSVRKHYFWNFMSAHRLTSCFSDLIFKPALTEKISDKDEFKFQYLPGGLVSQMILPFWKQNAEGKEFNKIQQSTLEQIVKKSQWLNSQSRN